MRLGSLFSGYGGLDQAISAELGSTTAWHAEIDKAASLVLSRHWPTTPNLGDITTIDWGAMKRAANRKLDPEQVRSAVAMYDAGLSLQQIAEYYGVSRQAMWDLVRRRTTMRPQQRYGVDNHFYRGGATADDRAHNIVEKAIERGALTRPERCEHCGTSAVFQDGRSGIQAHHCDYNLPLDVMWLCQPCHHDWHKHNRAIPVRGGDANGSLADIDILSGGFP